MAYIQLAGNVYIETSAGTKPETAVDGSRLIEAHGDAKDRKRWIRINGQWEEDISGAAELDDDIFEIVNGELTLKADFINSLGGEDNDGENVGDGIGLYIDKDGETLRFRTIEAGSNVTIDDSDPEKIVINASGNGGGGGGLELDAQITSSETLAAGRANKYVPVNSASPVEITIDSGVFSVNDVIVLEQAGNGIFEVMQGSGMTLNGATKSWGQYSVVKLFFKSASVATIVGGSE